MFLTAGNLPTSGHSWMSQTLPVMSHTLSGLQSVCGYTTRCAVNAAVSASIGPTSEVQSLARHARPLTAEPAYSDSRLPAVVSGTETDNDDDEYTDIGDDSSMLSLSINRFVCYLL